MIPICENCKKIVKRNKGDYKTKMTKKTNIISCGNCGKELTAKSMLKHKCTNHIAKLFYKKEYNFSSLGLCLMLFVILNQFQYPNKLIEGLIVLMLFVIIAIYEKTKDTIIKKIVKEQVK